MELPPGVPELQAATYALFVHVLLTTPHLLYGPLAAAILRVRPSDVFFFTRAGDEAETAGSAAD